MRNLLVLAVAAVVGSAVSSVAVAQEKLSGTEVQALLKGKTLNTRDDGFGGSGTISWQDGGVIAINLKKDGSGEVQADTGTYRFTDSGYCSTWKVLRTTEKCFTLRKAAGGYEIINPDGTVDSKLAAN